MAFPTEQRFIHSEEEGLGIELPDELRTRLLAMNGGEVATADDDWTLFPVFDNGDRKRAARTANHIARETQSARKWRCFPPEAGAIASNGRGDYLVLLPMSDKPTVLDRKVYLWAHETGSVAETAIGIGKRL